MLRDFIKIEILENIKSPRTIGMFLVALTLIPLSIFLNYKAFSDMKSNLSVFREKYREEFQQAPWSKIINGETPVLGFREPSPLYIYSNGIEREIPITVEFNRFFLKYRYQEEGGFSTILGKVDLEEIIGIIFSILALFFTYNAVSGEKESGTLRLILSNRVARYKILLGKMIGDFIIISIPLLTGFLIGLIILGLMNMSFLKGEILGRSLLLLIPSLLFIFVLVCFGLLVSCLTPNSKTSLATSFFFWIFFVLIIPSLSQLVGPILKPVESDYVHEKTVKNKIEDYKKDKSERLKDIYQKYMVNPGNESLWSEYAALRAPIMTELDKKFESQIGSLEEDFSKRRLGQKRMTSLISRISPLSSFRYIFSSVCGTSDALKEDFFNKSKFRQKFLVERLFDNFINDSVQVEPAFKGKVPNTVIGNIPGKNLLKKEDVLVFEFNPLKISFIQSIFPDFIWLAFMGLAFFMGSYFLFIKYDVR